MNLDDDSDERQGAGLALLLCALLFCAGIIYALTR